MQPRAMLFLISLATSAAAFSCTAAQMPATRLVSLPAVNAAIQVRTDGVKSGSTRARLNTHPHRHHAASPIMLSTATAAWTGGCVLFGASGAFVVVPNLKPWYESIKKPTWSPPNNIFAPMWTTLYIILGIASARTFGLNPLAQPRALAVFAVQAVLNLAWAPLFFGAKKLRLACFVSAALLASAVATSLEFARIAGRPTGLLLVPYILWLTYATGLNAKLWQLNGKTSSGADAAETP